MRINRVVNVKKRNFAVFVLFAVLSISFFATGVKAPTGWSRWYTTTVDSAGDVGYDSSIALDSNGNPHISYVEFIADPYLNNDLKYAKWTGSGWSIETVDSAGYVGQRPSIAVDSSGYPHISYEGNDHLKYARWTGSAWSVQTVDSAGIVGLWSSIALDSNDNPHISYLDFDHSDLKYARWTGSAWSIEVVDSVGAVGWTPSIALDSNDNPHISYFDYTNHDLKYARWTGSAWSIETVDSDGDVGYGSSIALDSGDNPHISYGNLTDLHLKYANWTGSGWSVQTVDSTTEIDFWVTSIALDSNGNPHISYADLISGALKYARWTGSAWSIETTDSAQGIGYWHSDIALDSSDNPHISYRDNTNADLRYATTSLPDNIWSSDSSGNPKDVFVPGEVVYVTAPSPRTYWTTVTLFVVVDKATWNDGDVLTDVSGGAEFPSTLNPGPTGSTQTFQIWSPPLAVGRYDIVMDKDNDGVFDAGLDLVDSVLITGFNVIPEVPFGTAMTFLSMIIALVGFVGFKRFRPKFQLK